MVSRKEAEVPGRSGQKEEQLKKLKDKVKGQFYGIIGECKGFDKLVGAKHLNIPLGKGSDNGIGVDDHSSIKYSVSSIERKEQRIKSKDQKHGPSN